MLLSRLAENVYWAGRYLERAEDTARLVKVYTELYMDMPSSVSVGWTPLLTVTGTHDAFDALKGEERAGSDGDDSLESRVIAFMTTSPSNPNAVLSCLTAARNNLRSVRALIPRSGWEQANRLHLWGGDTRAKAVPRRSRLEWADAVIRRCQTMTGLLDGQMSHDQAYAFLLAGRFLERADMTTRVLDVQASLLLGGGRDSTTYADVTWMGVLKSVSAMQMFRRVARAGVSGSRALNFLLTDPQFPRSVAHCLTELEEQLQALPRHDATSQAVRRACDRLDSAALDANLKAMAPAELHDFMDKLQGDIGEVHEQASATWFSGAFPDDQPSADTRADEVDLIDADAVPAPAAGRSSQSQSQSQTST